MITTEDMNKDVTVQVRLTAEEHERWLAGAELEDRTLSNWIRRQCNAVAASPEITEQIERKKRAGVAHAANAEAQKHRTKKGGRQS